MGVIASVAVSAATFAIDKLYDYAVPERLHLTGSAGVRVMVPFSGGNRIVEGVVFDQREGDTSRLKEISTVLDASPLLGSLYLELAKWMKARFFCTLYDAIKAMLPSGIWKISGNKSIETVRLAISREEAVDKAAEKFKRAPQQAALLRTLADFCEVTSSELCYFTGASRASLKVLEKQGLVELLRNEVFRRPNYSEAKDKPISALNGAQEAAYKTIASLMDGKASAALLYGVTGSGKTAVYINLISKAIEEYGQAIVLVPEIALTPQLVATFRQHFGDSVAVLHSSLTNGERMDEWRRINNGMVDVVVGTRSAVFAPVSRLKLLIIDEEQENTYKSESTPRYHARDVAKFLCAKTGALLVLGSATPSVESMYGAKTGKYELVKLTGRYNEKSLPYVRIVDMRKELRFGRGWNVSQELRDEIKKNLDAGEQTILFINRRGANSIVTCPECGYMYTCPQCSVNLTYHSANGRLMCHYCGHSQAMERYCPECGGTLKFVGAGTQSVETELMEAFPNVELVRMDTDTVTAEKSHEAILERFFSKKIPILIGTQMVTKGLNFENVTLVGVLNADQSLYAGDWRSQERTFSLITQVVGRSGRGEKQGRAVIQTFTPDNEVIRFAAAQDYDAFYSREIRIREMTNTPPFSEQLTILATGEDENKVIECCKEIKSALQNSIEMGQDIRILGPAPVSVVKVQKRYRYRVFVIVNNGSAIRGYIAGAIRKYSKDKRFRGVSLFGDIDPTD